MNYENNITNPEKKQKRPNYTLRRLGAAVGLAAAGAVLWIGVSGGPKSLEYSETTKDWTAQPGEGLDAAVSHVKILDSKGNLLDLNNVSYKKIVYYIQHMPENDIAVSDNIVQLGEEYEIPTSATIN